MKKIIPILMILAFVLGACAPVATPTEAPAPAATTAPQATEAPAAATEAPAAGGAIDGKGMLVGLSMDSLESAFWIANEKAIKAQAEKDNVKLVEVIAEGDANK
jgi:ABC-type sugar transport system substrate-binding protein